MSSRVKRDTDWKRHLFPDGVVSEVVAGPVPAVVPLETDVVEAGAVARQVPVGQPGGDGVRHDGAEDVLVPGMPPATTPTTDGGSPDGSAGAMWDSPPGAEVNTAREPSTDTATADTARSIVAWLKRRWRDLRESSTGTQTTIRLTREQKRHVEDVLKEIEDETSVDVTKQVLGLMSTLWVVDEYCEHRERSLLGKYVEERLARES